MRAGQTLAIDSDGLPRWWLLQAASRESRRESDKRAGRKRIATQTHPSAAPPAFYIPGKRECRERIWEWPRLLPRAGPGTGKQALYQRPSMPSNSAHRESAAELHGCSLQLVFELTPQPTFVPESTTAPKLALGPVVFRGAPAVSWQRVSSNPLPTGERLCTATAVD